MDHLDERQVNAYLARKDEFADPAVRKEAGRHIADCTTCSQRLTTWRHSQTNLAAITIETPTPKVPGRRSTTAVTPVILIEPPTPSAPAEPPPPAESPQVVGPPKRRSTTAVASRQPTQERRVRQAVAAAGAPPALPRVPRTQDPWSPGMPDRRLNDRRRSDRRSAELGDRRSVDRRIPAPAAALAGVAGRAPSLPAGSSRPAASIDPRQSVPASVEWVAQSSVHVKPEPVFVPPPRESSRRGLSGWLAAAAILLLWLGWSSRTWLLSRAGEAAASNNRATRDTATAHKVDNVPSITRRVPATSSPPPHARESDREIEAGDWVVINRTEADAALGQPLVIVSGLWVESVAKPARTGRTGIRVAQLTTGGDRLALVLTRPTFARSSEQPAGAVPQPTAVRVTPASSGAGTTGTAWFGRLLITARATGSTDSLYAQLNRLTEAPAPASQP